MKKKGKSQKAEEIVNTLSGIHLEDIDVSLKCPVLKKAVDSGDVHLGDLNALQFEVEALLSNISERAIYLTCGKKGTPLPDHLQPITESPEVKEKHLVVKSDPDKPLTLIIAQKRSAPTSPLDDDVKRPRMQTPLRGHILRSPSRGMMVNGESEMRRRSWVNGRGLPFGRSESSTEGLQNGFDSPDGRQNINKDIYAIPNKFWALMEPYCAEITEENIRTLEERIGQYDCDSELYKIPPLGSSDTHVTRKVKAEPLDNGHGGSRHSPTKEATTNGSHSLLRKIDAEIKCYLGSKIAFRIRQPMSDASPLASMTHSLVSTLSTENVTSILSQRVKEESVCSDSTIESRVTQPTKTLAKQLHVSNSYKLERRVRAGLDDLGSLPFPSGLHDMLNGSADHLEEEMDDEKTDDEVLSNLRRKQRELRLLSIANLASWRRLLVDAKRDMTRQEIQRRLAVADADVIEAYKKLESYRSSRKVPLKRDREVAWKALKERKKVVKELDAFDANI